MATASDPDALSKAFAELPLLGEVQHQGSAGVKAVTHNGLPIDFRIVPPENFGNLLQHFTGSGKHNEALRTAAVKRGFNVSEYGVIHEGETHACATEEEVYELLGMQYIPPELRENRGELDAARKGTLPELIAARRHPRRPAHAHRRERRALHDRADGRGGARARLRVHRDHRPLGDARLRQRRAAGRAAAPDRAGPRGGRGNRRHPHPRRHRGERAARRVARLRGRPARAARLDRREPALVVPDRRGASRPSG